MSVTSYGKINKLGDSSPEQTRFDPDRGCCRCHIQNEILVRLDRLAKRTGRSKTFYVTEAILDHLEDLEDAYLAERELAAIRAGRSTTTPLADVMKRYGMES